MNSTSSCNLQLLFCLWERAEHQGVGKKGLATLTVLGMDHTLVAPLLKEFADVFSNPVLSPDMHVTYDIHLIDPTS